MVNLTVMVLLMASCSQLMIIMVILMKMIFMMIMESADKSVVFIVVGIP